MKKKFLKQLKIIIAVLFLFAAIIPLSAQEKNFGDSSKQANEKDLIGIAANWLNIKQKNIDSVRLKKKVQFSLIPAASSVSGGGAAIVTAFNAAFYTGNFSTTSLSTVTFSPWFSFDGKFVLPFRNFIWLPDNVLLWKGDTRFMIYPQYTWGLGGKNDPDQKVLLEYNYLRLYQSLLKKVSRNIFIGGGYNLDYHYNMSAESDTTQISNIPGFDYFNTQNEKSTSSGPVINFLVDSRRNSINPSGGIYFGIDYRFNPESLGSTSEWQSVYVDARKYISFDRERQNILAFWSYYWAVTKGSPPYLDLPSIGWDYYNKSGRGIRQNRYRSNKLIYFETEYRKDISANGFWGFVVFANINSSAEYKTNDFVYWHPAAGAGLRIKFNKLSRTNVGLDFAASKDYAGIYILLGEAF